MIHETLTDKVVLAIDDIPKNLQLLGTILRAHGYKVMAATGGEQALQIASAKKPDLILLDIQMPQMDGFTVCQHLKDDPETADIPIIFLTARTDTDDIVRGFDYGAVDYLTKPFNPPELLARVAAHLELKQARDIIIRQNEELRQINEGKDKFFSIVAHDLRSPFAGFLGLTQLLADRADTMSPQDIKEFAVLMNASAEGTYTFLEDLLQWARAQMGKVQLLPESIAVEEVAWAVAGILGVTAANKEITLNDETSAEHRVFADLNTVSTVLRNLISNAIKFTPRGGVIRVSSRDEGDMIAISVSDNGVGMSAEAVSKLFRPEAASSNPGTNGEKGTGLGLLLCDELIRRNSGTISAHSESGAGTTFTFILPKPGI